MKKKKDEEVGEEEGNKFEMKKIEGVRKPSIIKSPSSLAPMSEATLTERFENKEAIL